MIIVNGNIPVLLTCEHGGTVNPGGVADRSCAGAPPECDCSITSDLKVSELTQAVWRRLSSLSSVYGNPYVVIAEVKRLYVDFNRTQACAYDDLNAAPYYAEYHAKVREFIDEMKVRFPNSPKFLFSIHGTVGVAPDTAAVYIGTNNGNTGDPDTSIKTLLARDPNALVFLRNLFVSQGYGTQPSAPDEVESYAGGYMVDAYGSQNADGIEAFCLEVDNSIRLDDALRNKFASDTADIIYNFVIRYDLGYPPVPVPAGPTDPSPGQAPGFNTPNFGKVMVTLAGLWYILKNFRRR